MAYPLFPDNSFPPARNEPCYCGSGQRFKRCCGSQADNRAPPHGIGIADDFLSAAECAALVAMADSMQGHRFAKLDQNGRKTLDPHRATEWVDFRDTQQQVLDAVVARAFEHHIVPATGQKVAWYEQPQVLRYAPGGFYKHHADAYILVPELGAWRKAVDRDISMLIYLNDDYEGGELDFRRLFFRMRPKAGMLVWFPSDVRYEHMAMQVTSGRRYCIVSWAAVEGVERVQAERMKRVVVWEDRPRSGG
jgi:predicted 2-oxoglutarate/Fe(II)-dependent dioxygenase YbiX